MRMKKLMVMGLALVVSSMSLAGCQQTDGDTTKAGQIQLR